jgi:hypothetical protein
VQAIDSLQRFKRRRTFAEISNPKEIGIEINGHLRPRHRRQSQQTHLRAHAPRHCTQRLNEPTQCQQVNLVVMGACRCNARSGFISGRAAPAPPAALQEGELANHVESSLRGKCSFRVIDDRMETSIWSPLRPEKRKWDGTIRCRFGVLWQRGSTPFSWVGLFQKKNKAESKAYFVFGAQERGEADESCQ